MEKFKKDGLTRYQIFLDKNDYKQICERAEKMGLNFSAYVRALIRKDLEENNGR